MNISGISYSDFVVIDNENFKDINFSNSQITAFDFVNCSFDNCDFTDSTICSCLFKECSFINTDLTFLKVFESEFESTIIKNCNCGLLHIADCTLKKTQYINCLEIMDAYFRNRIYEEVIFKDSNIQHCKFEGLSIPDTPQIEFSNCLITHNYFASLDLKEFRFSNSSQLNLNVFQNCKIQENTFDNSLKTTGQEYNSIDFSTINKSVKINDKSLKTLFGILNSDIKNYIFGLTNEVKLQSVFISYSFKDKDFANKINNSLKSNGVITFLWENDAPGGKRLKNIMKENVNRFDRVLFIASEHSLRSEACQFELSEGRKKQEKLWRDIYFPIHIDNYLFEVEKEDIRPIEMQDEYWENIQELKHLNSVDFSVLIENPDENKYDSMIYNLVRDLKK